MNPTLHRHVKVHLLLLLSFGGPHGFASAAGPDVAICSLDSLQQVTRVGDKAALAAATTSWNVGDRRLDWYEEPDERHPFIVTNLFRIKGDQFEQIGQSWVKHGFYALSNSQCGSGCNDETDGTQLGVNCTDTYGSNLNANPAYLAPRFEVNPWTGVWKFAGSHFSTPHQHQETDHQMLVKDSDLDPGSNAGATYFVEAYYVHYQDVDVTNSAAWKPVAIRGTSALWRFQMAGRDVQPTSGFALDAWTGAEKTVFAQQLPVVEGRSPDGRAILAAKAVQAGSNWRYSYALLNVDMDRQVSGLKIPVGSATPTKVSFSAPAHGDPVNSPGGTPIDNAVWQSTFGNGDLHWRTASNPVRWGTVYSFSFESPQAPGRGQITLELFKQGTPGLISAEAIVPGGGAR